MNTYTAGRYTRGTIITMTVQNATSISSFWSQEAKWLKETLLSTFYCNKINTFLSYLLASANLKTSDSCSKLLQSVTSSANEVKSLILFLMVIATVDIISFWIVFHVYKAFLGAFSRYYVCNSSLALAVNWTSSIKLPLLELIAALGYYNLWLHLLLK